MKKILLAAVAAAVCLSAPAESADTEQKYGFKPDSFEIKFYMQPRYTVQLDDTDEDTSFGVRRGRVYLTSTVAPDVKGRIQFEVKPDKVEALDVYFDWGIKSGLRKPYTVTIGQFKKPFSYQELVMSSSNLNLIDRTVTNEFLEKGIRASSRDQGAMLSVDLWEYDTPAMIQVGMFNGNGKGKAGDTDSGKQFVGRVDGVPTTGLSLGANASLTRIEGELSGGGTGSESFLVWGGEAVYQKSGLMIVGELSSGDNYESVFASTPVVPESPDSFLGWYVEGIYRAPSGWEPAVRLERFDPSTDVDDDAQTILTGQIARSFSPNLRWQLNLIHTEEQDPAADSDTRLVSQWTVRL